MKQSSQPETPDTPIPDWLIFLESAWSPPRAFFKNFDMNWYPLLRFSRVARASNPFSPYLFSIDLPNFDLPMLKPSTQQYSKQVKMINLHENWENRSIVYSNIKYMSLLRLNCKWLEFFFLAYCIFEILIFHAGFKKRTFENDCCASKSNSKKGRNLVPQRRYI